MKRDRLRRFALAALALFAAVFGAVAHAIAKRHAWNEGPVRAFTTRTGATDLALSTSSRWLRHPSVAEPAAACQDQPPCFDTDPAGLAIAPPGSFYARVSIQMTRVPADASEEAP